MYQDWGELIRGPLSSCLALLSATSLKFVFPGSVLGLFLEIFSVILFLSVLVKVSFLFKALLVSSILSKTFLCLSASIDFCFFSAGFSVLA